MLTTALRFSSAAGVACYVYVLERVAALDLLLSRRSAPLRGAREVCSDCGGTVPGAIMFAVVSCPASQQHHGDTCEVLPGELPAGEFIASQPADQTGLLGRYRGVHQRVQICLELCARCCVRSPT